MQPRTSGGAQEPSSTVAVGLYEGLLLSVQPRTVKTHEPSSTVAPGTWLSADGSVQPTTAYKQPSLMVALESKLAAAASMQPRCSRRQLLSSTVLVGE